MKEVVEKYQQKALEAQPGRTVHESFEAQVGDKENHRPTSAGLPEPVVCGANDVHSRALKQWANLGPGIPCRRVYVVHGQVC